MTRTIKHTSMRATFIPRQRDDVTSVEVDGEAVLYDERFGSLHVLNPTAALLWRCFDGSGTITEIAADVADAFGSDPSAVTKDVLKVARQLGRQGLIDGVAPDPNVVPERGAVVEDERAAEGPRFLDEPPDG